MALGLNVAPNIYDIGDVVTIAASFLVGSTLTDPTTTTLVVMAPDTTETTVTQGTLVHDSVGKFHYNYSIPVQAGNYNYRWTGTGTCIASSEGNFVVRSRQTP